MKFAKKTIVLILVLAFLTSIGIVPTAVLAAESSTSSYILAKDAAL